MKLRTYQAAAGLFAITGVINTATAKTSSNPFAHKTSPNTPKSSYMNKLRSNARPTTHNGVARRLDDQEIDITSYSIKFEKCQYIKQYKYNDENQNDDEIDTVLEMKHFVIFKLCPNNNCGYDSCSNSNYGEYMIDMDTYLEATLKHMEEEQEMYCQACEECGMYDDDGDDDAAAANNVADDAAANNYDDANGRRTRNLGYKPDCSTCYTECQNIENMEENGYVDAAEYLNCEKVYENENKGLVYYAGPICSNNGERIKVGLFIDEECTLYDANASPDQYLKNENGYNIKLSYHILKRTFMADGCIASCTKVNENDDDDDGGDIELAEICEDLYDASGKCENPHGFENGMDYSNSEYYDVQMTNEENVCEFITNIQANHYDMYGEVIVMGGNQYDEGEVKTSGAQKFALTFLSIGVVFMTWYAVMLRRKISKQSKGDQILQGSVSIDTVYMA